MKGKIDFMVFFVIVLTVNVLVNLYIFQRSRSLLPSGNLWWPAGILFWLVAFSYVLGRFAERAGWDIVASVLVKTGSWWLGAMVYLTLAFLLLDLLRGINALVGFSDWFSFSWRGPAARKFAASVFFLTSIVMVGGYVNALSPVVRRISVEIGKPLPGSPFRVILVSDIHMGMMISNGRLAKLVDLVNKEKGDVVLLAGDVFDEDPGPVIKNNMGDLLREFNARYGVFAVAGNHEFYGNLSLATQYLKEHNITVLRDSVAFLPNGAAIVGREDITGDRMFGKPRKSMEELLGNIGPSVPVIVMDHQPYHLAQVAQHNVDLQVSGHTHHGQMWPFNYITRAIFEISRGSGKINQTHFYVSSGFGTWGPPIRTNSRPEVVVIELIGK